MFSGFFFKLSTELVAPVELVAPGATVKPIALNFDTISI